MAGSTVDDVEYGLVVEWGGIDSALSTAFKLPSNVGSRAGGCGFVKSLIFPCLKA